MSVLDTPLAEFDPDVARLSTPSCGASRRAWR